MGTKGPTITDAIEPLVQPCENFGETLADPRRDPIDTLQQIATVLRACGVARFTVRAVGAIGSFLRLRLGFMLTLRRLGDNVVQ